MQKIKVGIYYTLGDGSLEKSIDLFTGALQGGAKLLEIGLPFSDPLLDGPVVQQSHNRAIESNNARWGDVCTAISKITAAARSYEAEVSVMTTAQLLYTPQRRSELPKVDGLLVTDIEAFANAPFLLPSPRVWFLSQDLALLKELILPTEPLSMVYLTRLQGVTGEKQQAAPQTAAAIARLKQLPQLSGKNVWLGFGISNAEDVQEAAKFGADGVVVGSAFVKMATSLPADCSSEKIRTTAKEFVEALLGKSG